MKRQDSANEIPAIPFLTGMNDPHLRVLADCACRTHFDEGQIEAESGFSRIGAQHAIASGA
jgi:hypothetical protein